MSKTKTTRYDFAEHLRTPEEMAAYLEACLKEVPIKSNKSNGKRASSLSGNGG
jgi:DNA-binding phage protein